MTNEGGVRAIRSLGIEVPGIWAQQLFEGRLALRDCAIIIWRGSKINRGSLNVIKAQGRGGKM